MFKQFLLKKLVQSKLKNVPQEQQEKILAAVEKNPELFHSIAKEVQQEMKSGKGEMVATMVVMQRHQAELQKVMNE